MKNGINNTASRWGSMFGTTQRNDNKNVFRGDDQEDSLLLFREIHKRSEKERTTFSSNSNFLQLISSDQDLLDYSISNPDSGSSNYPLYHRTHSAKKINGMELPMERGKNDYDWLKTPPATPLFPSLEMEMDNKAFPEFVIQREIPILQPLTRFSGNNLESELNHRPKSPKTPTKAAEIKGASLLLATPTNSSRKQPNGPNPDNLHPALPNLRTTASTTSTRSSSASRGRLNCNNNTINPSTPKSSSTNRQQQSSGYSINSRSTSTTKDRPSSASRGSRYNNNSTNNGSNPTNSSDQGPRPGTITTTGTRSSSASKSRLNYNITKLSSSVDEDRRSGSYVKTRRQSVSPSTMRGRESISVRTHKQPEINNEQEQEHALTTIMSSRDRIHRSSGGNNNGSSNVNVFGSKMVDKVMNARRSSTLSSVAAVNQGREVSHKHKAKGLTSSSTLMTNNEVSGLRSSSLVAAQNQNRGTLYKSKFESSTSSSSSPISNEKPGAGRPKTARKQENK